MKKEGVPIFPIKIARVGKIGGVKISKITHQMPHDHPFSQRNRSTEGPVGVGVGGDRGVERGGGLDKI